MSIFYPFCVVVLYSLLKMVLTDSDVPVPVMAGKEKLRNRRAASFILFMLDFGLPCIVIIFIIIFWVLGIANIIAS